MICLEDFNEFSPFGRSVSSLHPLQNADQEERWHIEEDGDEIYYRGSTVIWSSADTIKKCLTLHDDIRDVMRCRFFGNPDRPKILPIPAQQEPGGEEFKAICVRNYESIRIFFDSGDEYKVHLQFHVLRSWKSKYGIILERQVLEKEKPRPVLFCLLHPLDDFTRVVWKQGLKLAELTDQSDEIVYIDEDPSIVITFNSTTGLHSVCRIRRAYLEEVEAFRNLPESGYTTPYTGPNTPYTGGVNTPFHGGASANPSWTPNTSCKIGSGSQSVVMTPVAAKTSRNPSGSPSGFNAYSPGTRPSSPASRIHSPQSVGAFLRSGASPTFSAKVASRLGETLNRRQANMAEELEANPHPVEVTLCFEHLWTESPHPSKNSGKAWKVFKTTDCIEQSYYCLVLPNNTISLLKYKFANDDSNRLIFGAEDKIPAMDAAAVPSLNMLMVLDQAGSLSLYSGANKIGKTILPPSSTALLSQEIGALALDSKPGTPFMDCHSSTPLPALSTKIFASTPMNSPSIGKSFTTVSPVTSDASSIVSVKDSVDRKVTLAYNSGYMLRVSLPRLSTALVGRALEAVEHLLPRELAQSLHGSWYAKRHAPGPLLNRAAEWDMFCKFLLGMSGYQVDYLDLSSSEDVASGCPGPKRSRTELGTDGDWQYLLDSPQHSHTGHSISKILCLSHVSREASEPKMEVEEGIINPSCPLFPYIPGIFSSLHLVYEESKLDTSVYNDLHLLANLLSRLAADLRLAEYQHHYWKDFPENSLTGPTHSQLTPDLLSRLNLGNIPGSPSCIHSHLLDIQLKQAITPFPINLTLNPEIKLVTSCFAVMNCGNDTNINLEMYLKPLSQHGRPGVKLQPLVVGSRPHQTVAELITAAGWQRSRILNLPASVSIPLTAALSAAQLDPKPSWGQNIIRLIGREDLAENCNVHTPEAPSAQPRSNDEEQIDGLEGLSTNVTKLRWPKDLRVNEAKRMLQSARPVTVSVGQGPNVSDHEFVEEQEYFLKRICERTMAISVGRGIAVLRTTAPLPTEILSVPKLCLTGRAPPRGTRVEMTHIDISPNMDHWPSFHNGVAAGLRLCADPESSEIDSTWIAFNKPAEASAETEHAGFLMSLGLNGHLCKLSNLDAFDYLSKGTEPISIGLLLGVASSHVGSMDVMVTKKLATQLEALLPPTATELPLSHNTQVAALMGIGLLYANTGHRHMVEVCLKELGKPPGPELENCVDRESYSLTAGLALGMITMGKGEALVVSSLADLNLTDVLHNHMLGGPRSGGQGPAKEKQQSYQIKEGDNINIDITSPGATLALGMLYWRSGNKSIASWLSAPKTIFLLDFVRPDFLMLRTLAKGLILWDEIQPSRSWIESHVPRELLPFCLVRPPDNPPPGLENVDYETLNQAYCNIIAGAAFALGLRYAGSWNAEASNAIYQLLKRLIAVSKRSLAELTGKAVVEQSICILLLSQAMIMAGSGDVTVLRSCRLLRSRILFTGSVNYGSYMAIHMALGLNFLGGGKYGLTSTPLAIASLIIAFYPKFPTHSNDNRYHLQAFRHLYVLAVEPRLIIPRCSQTGQIVPVKMRLKASSDAAGSDVPPTVTAPILLPPLHAIEEIATEDPRYLNLKFNKEDGWMSVRRLLENGGSLFVKKTGMMRSRGFSWSISEEERERFARNLQCSNILEHFFKEMPAEQRVEREGVVSNCISRNHEQMIPALASLIASISQLSLHRVGLVAHQLRSVLSARKSDHSCVEQELIISMLQKVNTAVDTRCRERPNLAQGLRQQLLGASPSSLDITDRQMLSSIVTLNNISPPSNLSFKSSPPTKDSSNPLKMMKMLNRSPSPATTFRLLLS